MQVHTLFNVDDPICLYCKSSCDFFATGDNYTILYFIDHYTCQKCGELFGIHYVKELPIHGFEFSCNSILVFCDYKSNLIGIKKNISEGASEFMWVPSFDIIFEDKLALYNKLKIYLTFA